MEWNGIVLHSVDYEIIPSGKTTRQSIEDKGKENTNKREEQSGVAYKSDM